MQQVSTNPSTASVKTSRCSALIRTFNSEKTLPAVLASLNAQTRPPDSFIFVDSGSVDGTLSCVPKGAVVHNYVGKEFNFAESLNQGLRFATGDFVLIISSHTSLENRGALEYALNLLDSDKGIGAAYFVAREGENGLEHEFIDKDSFDGFNGFWNSSGLVRVSLLKERAFRPEVFSAEDQEWANWYFLNKGGKIARIYGGGWTYGNPRGNSVIKRLNEIVAVAYFVKREMMSWENVLRLAWRAIKPGDSSRLYGRRYYFRLASRLLACHFWRPRHRSKYF